MLLVDTDPQGSLTASLGYVEPDEIPITLGKCINSSDQRGRSPTPLEAFFIMRKISILCLGILNFQH